MKPYLTLCSPSLYFFFISLFLSTKPNFLSRLCLFDKKKKTLSVLLNGQNLVISPVWSFDYLFFFCFFVFWLFVLISAEKKKWYVNKSLLLFLYHFSCFRIWLKGGIQMERTYNKVLWTLRDRKRKIQYSKGT